MAYIVGYFFVMLLFMALAILCAKRETSLAPAWVLYAVGAIFQLISLIGTQKSIDVKRGYSPNMTTLWLVYIALLTIAAFIILSAKSSKPDS